MKDIYAATVSGTVVHAVHPRLIKLGSLLAPYRKSWCAHGNYVKQPSEKWVKGRKCKTCVAAGATVTPIL